MLLWQQKKGNTRESAVEVKRMDVALADGTEKRGTEGVGAGRPSCHSLQQTKSQNTQESLLLWTF